MFFFTSDSYNPEQPQFDRTPVWMRLGNGRLLHPLPARGGFHPIMGLRSWILPVTPNQTQLTVRGIIKHAIADFFRPLLFVTSNLQHVQGLTL